MSVAYTPRIRLVMIVAAIACAAGLVLTGARSGHGTDPPGGDGPSPAPAVGTSAPGTAYAGRSQVFGLVAAGRTPDTVLFAPARKVQPAGPETVHPADVGPYVPLRLDPEVVIRASAPIVNEGVTDWARGVRLTPEEFHVLLLRLQERLRPLLARAHMFELWFDARGRITRMQHYFSP